MDRDGFLSRRDGAVRRGTCGMNSIAEVRSSKVPEVTLAFWIIKILATTLGETGGYALSMTMNLGYAISTAIFFALFIVTIAAQVSAKSFHPFLYWSVIVATTTAGTTMADYADRSLGIGYVGGSLILFTLLILVLGLWRLSVGSVSVANITSPKVEIFYWTTILFSNTLGTALGDFLADDSGRLRRRGARVRRHAGSRRGRLLPYESVPHIVVLAGVHPDAAARCDGRRSPDQTSGGRRV
jgi:uncharacterized membrane-anchored protein